MKIEFDTQQELSMFEALLDSFRGVAELEMDEIDFLDKISNEIHKGETE